MLALKTQQTNQPTFVCTLGLTTGTEARQCSLGRRYSTTGSGLLEAQLGTHISRTQAETCDEFVLKVGDKVFTFMGGMEAAEK